MPRILPRLLKNVSKNPPFLPVPFKRRRRKSLYRTPLQTPSMHPKNYHRSILLTPENPITRSRDYIRHKLRGPSAGKPGKQPENVSDKVRRLSSEEYVWWSNPYLRMLASPLRTCLVTKRVVPQDFLLRLGPMRLPDSALTGSSHKSMTSGTALVPDGLLHPKFAPRRVGRAGHVFCSRSAISQLRPEAYRRTSNIMLSLRLADHIAHLLRLRVLQELELLAERLEYRTKRGQKFVGTGTKILRRLRKVEWNLVRSSATIPFANAAAILVVPPVNKDKITKERPKGSMSPLPVEDEDSPKIHRPASELLCSKCDASNNNSLSRRQVPLYNGATLFPSRSQRAALHAFLLRILAAEAFIRQASPPQISQADDPQSSICSHAFLLCSDRAIARRADVAAVSIALWRLQLFEAKASIDTT